MKIWLVDIFEPLPEDGFPPQRYAHLAAELGRRGHQVVRFSADFVHLLKAYRDAPPTVGKTEIGGRSETRLPTKTRLLHAPAYRGNVSLRRLLSHAAVALDAGRVLDREPQPPELIVACWGPVELAAACVRFARRHRVPICLDVLDPWPDSFAKVLPAPLARLSSVLLWPHQRLARWTVSRCDGLTGISRTFVAWARARRADGGAGVASEIFWPSAPRRGAGESRQGGPLRCVFAGTFGAMYDQELILDAAATLQRSRPGEVRFELVGDGPRRLAIERRFGQLPNVTFHGRLRAAALDRVMHGADVGFCCYPAGAPTTLTTTFFFYLSYGLAVLATPQQELAELVTGHGLGSVVTDRTTLVSAIARLADDRERLRSCRQAALAFAHEHSVEQVSRRMASFVEALAPRPAPCARGSSWRA